MNTNFDKSAHKTQWIKVKYLSCVWAEAQRETNQARVDKYAAEFDPDLFDDLVVTLPNGDGIYHVIDGLHRRGFIQKLFGEDEHVPCRVVNATDPARAAEIFHQLNTSRKAPSAVEKFKVRVTAGHEVECAINRIVTQLGYRVGTYTGDGIIRSVGALTHVYKSFGSEVLKETLMTIKATWLDDAHAVDGPIIEGYGALIGEHRGHLDWKRLRERVAIKYTPGRLLGYARSEKDARGGTLGAGVRVVLLRAYNQGLRNGKLPE